MKTRFIIILLIIAEFFSVVILNLHYRKRENILRLEIEKKNENIDELYKSIELLKQKLLLESINETRELNEQKLRKQLEDANKAEAERKKAEAEREKTEISRRCMKNLPI